MNISQINQRQLEIKFALKKNKKLLDKANANYDSGLKGWDMQAKNLEIEIAKLNKEYEDLTKQKITLLLG